MKDGAQETLLVFTDKDAVKGEVTLKMDVGKRLEHIGVKVEFIGQIEMFYGNMHEFIAMVRDLDAPGEWGTRDSLVVLLCCVAKGVG